MNSTSYKQFFNQSVSIVVSACLILSSLGVAPTAMAAALALPDAPLDTTSFAAKTNIMFVLDNSGSMSKNYVSTTVDDNAPALMRNSGQCKAALRDKTGHQITKLEQDGTKLKIKTSGGNYTKGDIVYLAVPGKNHYSGVYKIKESNYSSGSTATTTTTCNPGTDVYNSSIIVNDVTGGATIQDTSGTCTQTVGGEVLTYACPVVPGCAPGPKPANDPLWFGPGNKTITTGATGSNVSRCAWRDPADNPVGTVWQSCITTTTTTGTNVSPTSGTELEVDIVPLGPDDEYKLSDNDPEVLDAYITMSIGYNTAATPAPDDYQQSSSCPRYDYWNDANLFGDEPPQNSAQINGLFYNPQISYTPPPHPKKLGLAPPANLLPAMTSAYTNGWRWVPTDGLRLTTAAENSWAYSAGIGNPIPPASLQWSGEGGVYANLTAVREMVYCDTPQRPTNDPATGSPWTGANNTEKDKKWHESIRCKKNDLTTNNTVKSPSYPYQYPASTIYSAASPIPATATFYVEAAEHQYGASNISAAGKAVVAGLNSDGLVPSGSAPSGGLYPYGEFYYFAKPHYFNVKPIEHCTTAQLTDCQLGAASGAYVFPSYVRYCKRYNDASDGAHQPIDFSATNPACQAKFTGNVNSNNWNNPVSGNYAFARYGLFERVDIKSGGTYAVDPATSKVYKTRYDEDSSGNKIAGDCASANGCTFDEEMTNYANWYAYYRTRLLLMKSASANAFNPFDANKRIGLMTINEPDGVERSSPANAIKGAYLPIADFDTASAGQKEKWLTALYAVKVANDGTPLREALANVGKVYAGLAGNSALPSGDIVRNLPPGDPVEYACQSNFTILTTDGYWNGPAGTKLPASTSTFGTTTLVGNQDGGARPSPVPAQEKKWEGAVVSGHPAAPDTLADVAKYYADTDLRTGILNNCSNPSPSDSAAVGQDVCYNGSNASLPQIQKMTTYTLGLGVDGDMNYTSDYDTATSGDFYNRTTSNLGWPVPSANQPSSVDDLWHAAVNGNGRYFSAKSPAEVEKGLTEALASASSGLSSGSPPAVTSGEPVAGDYGFSTSYASVVWSGNLVARNLSTTPGSFFNTSTPPVWCADTPNSADTTLALCPAPLLPTRASLNNRNILFNRGSNVLSTFNYTNLTVAGLNVYFDDAYLAGGTINYAGNTSLPFTGGLSNWSAISANAHAGEADLVNFLRGVKTYETINTTSPGVNDLYRKRVSTLGDIIDSDPVFVGQPQFSYVDDNYLAFKTAQANRAKLVYVGANDGMLHAFNAKDDPVDATNKPAGDERFAFIPSILMPKLHKLAEVNYSTNHKNFVNGDPVVGDVCVSNCSSGSSAVWKTILVSGLAQGGRGYFALDITDPDSPALLWEFDVSHDADLGYSYGKPVITKRGTEWVVLLTSGYNNTAPGDGNEYLYVLRASDGTKLDKIGTSAASNGGLAQISGLALDNLKDNTTQYVYGGDLLGNLWKFDIGTSGTYAGTVSKLAKLKAGSYEQPVTTRPILVREKNTGAILVIVGTGKLVEHADAVSSDQQTLYGIRDSSGSTFVNPRGDSTFVEQVLTGKNSDNTTVTSTNPATVTTTFTLSNNPVGTTDNGWYIDLLPKQRQTVQAQLLAGVLRIPTHVTTGNACAPEGYGVAYKLNYATGASIDNSTTTVVSSSTPTPVTGFVYQVKTDSSGNKIGETGASGSCPECGGGGDMTILNPGENLLGGGEYAGNRLNWRELLE